MGIVIIGNSGAARECHWIWMQMRAADAGVPDFKGFVSWEGYKGELKRLAGLLLGDSRSWLPCSADLLVIGIGDCGLRLKIYRHYKKIGAKFFTLRHPSALVAPSANLGEANILAALCSICPDAGIGHANYLNGAVVIGHDAVIGNANTLNLSSSLGGHASMGDGNMFGPHCTLLPNASIGNWNVLAPGTVVYKGCGDHCLMAGNPALIMEKRS